MIPDSNQDGSEQAGAELAASNHPIPIPLAKVPSERLCHQVIGLTIAGGAIGRSVLLQMPDGRRLHPGMNVIFATESPGPVMDALATILAPFKYRQAERHSEFAKLDPESHNLALAEAKAERLTYEESDIMPDPGHLLYFGQQIAELQNHTRPMALLENPPPGRLTLAIGKSADSSLLVVYDDLSFGALLDATRTSRGAMDFELLGKSFRQEIFDAAYLEGISDAAVVSPIVTMIAVVRPETAARFLSSPLPIVAGFADTCLVVSDSEDLPEGANPVPTATLVANWQRAVTRLMASREEPTRIIGLGPEAVEVLAGFASRVAEAYRNAPTSENRYLNYSPRLASKLALLQHVTQQDSSTLIPGEIAASAVAMAELSTEHRLSVLEAGCTEPAATALRTAVREKIVDFGPLLSRRKIRRHFHALKTEKLVPVLLDLVQAQEIVEEQEGCYSVVALPQLQTVTG
jgi:hypothetical protein